jgi:mannitol/fructose-specific phosphotransferase system IIA component (Ntr-type)
VDALVDARVVADGDPIYKHLCKWEPEYGSWACFGHQIAIPHMRTDLVDRLHVAIGVLPQGIDWLAPDDRPVLAAFLFLVPRAQPGEHMRWLKQLHQAIQQFDIMPALARCRTPDEVCELLRQTDQKLLPPG